MLKKKREHFHDNFHRHLFHLFSIIILGVYRMNTLYLNKDDTHIKLIQLNPNEAIYVKSSDGSEMLYSQEKLCEGFMGLIEKYSRGQS